jgi:hypothetical protein
MYKAASGTQVDRICSECKPKQLRDRRVALPDNPMRAALTFAILGMIGMTNPARTETVQLQAAGPAGGF